MLLSVQLCFPKALRASTHAKGNCIQAIIVLYITIYN